MQPILGTMTFSDQVDRDTSASMITAFIAAGHAHLDTAYVYNKGNTEKLLGELNNEQGLNGSTLATKVNPSEGGLSAESVDRQFTTSLQRLHEDAVDLLYLHSPDLDTPIEQTVRAIQQHFEAGRIKRFGLSNYAAWQVAEICEMCRRNGWLEPSVYQGMYNAFTRDVERELFHCLSNYDMAFYAYNPLAGGLLTGKYQNFDAPPPPGRFAHLTFYQERYWKQDYFAAVSSFVEACKREDIQPAAAAIRWMVHHSDLASTDSPGNPHGIILGVTSMRHFEQNLGAVSAGALPDQIVAELDSGWETVRPACIKYFRP